MGRARWGRAPKSIEEQNRELADICAAYPDRYIFFSCIDPRAPGALEFVERSVEEWNAKGFKFHPNMSGLYPWHEAAYPIYERLQDLRAAGAVPHGADVRASRPQVQPAQGADYESSLTSRI